MTVPCACATLTSKALLAILIQFAEKSRNWKRAFKRLNGTLKRVSFSGIFSVAFISKSLCFSFESNVLISDVDLYPLFAHGIKCNTNPLTPNQITFKRCLADTKNHTLTPNTIFYIHSKLGTILKSVLNFVEQNTLTGHSRLLFWIVCVAEKMV